MSGEDAAERKEFNARMASSGARDYANTSKDLRKVMVSLTQPASRLVVKPDHYKITRDGVEIGTVYADSTTSELEFFDPSPKSGDGSVYEVTAVYKDGQELKSQPVEGSLSSSVVAPVTEAMALLVGAPWPTAAFTQPIDAQAPQAPGQQPAQAPPPVIDWSFKVARYRVMQHMLYHESYQKNGAHYHVYCSQPKSCYFCDPQVRAKVNQMLDGFWVSHAITYENALAGLNQTAQGQANVQSAQQLQQTAQNVRGGAQSMGGQSGGGRSSAVGGQSVGQSGTGTAAAGGAQSATAQAAASKALSDQAAWKKSLGIAQEVQGQQLIATAQQKAQEIQSQLIAMYPPVVRSARSDISRTTSAPGQEELYNYPVSYAPPAAAAPEGKGLWERSNQTMKMTLIPQPGD